MKYRADIDGLRGISVLMVLFFHAGVLKIRAGFIGVDIFFVISGFLITTIIINSLNENRFNLFEFYRRRFLRLAPALIVLIIVTTAIAVYFYLPADLIYYAKSAQSALLYTSNLYFARTTGGYFDTQSDNLLLLHAWSLAVEWQWYALLPLILWLGYHVLGRRFLPWLVMFLCLICLGWTLYQSHGASPTGHYYGLPSRAFELLTGACVAFFPVNYFKNISRSVLSSVGILALCLILGLIFISNVNVMYPNYYAAFVCLCASGLVIIGQIDPDNAATRLLSQRWLVFIGLISYSLYLWHWPVFATLNYLDVEKSRWLTSAALFLSLILGVISWRFIEQKTRYLRNWHFVSVILCLFVLPVGIFWGLARLVENNAGFQQRFQQTILTEFVHKMNVHQSEGRRLCIDAPDRLNDPVCQSGTLTGQTKRALVLGDSFANQYWNFIDVFAKDAGVEVTSNTRSTCLMLQGIYLFDVVYLPKQPYYACDEQTQTLYQKMTEQPYDFIILAQVWSNYLADKIIETPGDERSRALSITRIEQALDRSVQMILGTGAQLIIIDETYKDKRNEDNKCYFRALKMHRNEGDVCDIDYKPDLDELTMKQMLTALRQKYPQIIFVDPKLIQCPDNNCKAVTDDGMPIFGYGMHLNDYAAFVFGQQYMKNFGNPFLKNN